MKNKKTATRTAKKPIKRKIGIRRYKLVDASTEKGGKGPSLDAKYNIQPGQFAKLIFIEKGIPQPERMWVRVEKRGTGGKYVGVLDNKPVLMKNIRLGDKITFSTRNIIAIMK